MRLDYTGCDKEIINGGVNLKTASATTRAKYIKNIFEKKVSVMLDFLDLPDTPREEIEHLKNVGKKIRKGYTDLVVLGIGGSALGVRLLENTFYSSMGKSSKVKVTVCDNIDPDGFVSILDKLNLKKTMFNVICKSGGTSETMAQMLVAIDRLISKKLELSKHMIVTTTVGNALYKFAQDNGMETFSIPVGVGGRFSILSPVGLLPASAMDIDIEKLLMGAKILRENAKLNDIKNLSFDMAYICNHFLKAGKTSLVVMPYVDRLKTFPEFFAQLWAESLGKKVDRAGKEVFAGQTPIKSLGVTDQHSQLQLYSEGINDKVIMFITTKNTSLNSVVKDDTGLAKHLDGVTLKELIDHEYNSTAYSLTTRERPNFTIELDSIDEESVGKLIMLSEMATAYMGEMLSINTYDQPGVELSKIYTKACLKVKGYENEYRNIREYKKNKKSVSL